MVIGETSDDRVSFLLHLLSMYNRTDTLWEKHEDLLQAIAEDHGIDLVAVKCDDYYRKGQLQ